MRAIERDRLLRVLSWVYLVGLVLVSAYYLLPLRSVPAGTSASFDLSALPVPEDLDFAKTESLIVRPSIATRSAERELDDLISKLGGDPIDRTVPTENDEEKLLAVLGELRTFSRGHRRVGIQLTFEPSGVVVRLNRGTFDDQDGRIGKALLARKKRLAAEAKTATTAADHEDVGSSTSALDAPDAVPQ